MEESSSPAPQKSAKELKKEQKAAKKREKKLEKDKKLQAKLAKKRKLLFPANKKGKHVMHLLNFLRVLFYPVHYVVYPYKLHGHKKVGPGAYIYVGNHYCIWDVFYPARTTWEGLHFLTKESIMHAPVLRTWAYKLGAIPAMRDGSDVRTVMESMKVLKNGEKISLFPEGTRNKGEGDEFLPFHGGAALLAIKTKTPIVPFVICNRPRVWHMTHVVFGEPMEFSEFYDRKLKAEDYEAADQKLIDRLYELRAEFRAQREAKKRKKKRK